MCVAVIAEAIVKIVGLRYHYFTVPWNLFDFLLVVASILGILMEDIMIDFPVSPTLLRVVRVFRIGRILRLIKVKYRNWLMVLLNRDRCLHCQQKISWLIKLAPCIKIEKPILYVTYIH